MHLATSFIRRKKKTDIAGNSFTLWGRRCA